MIRRVPLKDMQLAVRAAAAAGISLALLSAALGPSSVLAL